MKKKKSIYDIQYEFLTQILMNRNIPNVGVSKHFIERTVTRRIDPKLIMNAINKLANNICQTIFECEIGKEPSIRCEDFVICLTYIGDGRIVLTTCFQTSNNY